MREGVEMHKRRLFMMDMLPIRVLWACEYKLMPEEQYKSWLERVLEGPVALTMIFTGELRLTAEDRVDFHLVVMEGQSMRAWFNCLRGRQLDPRHTEMCLLARVRHNTDSHGKTRPSCLEFV